MKNSLLFLLSLFILFSCENSNNLFSDITGDSTKLFRDHEINNSPQKVKDIENSKFLVQEEEYSLTYKYNYAQGDVNIDYSFDEKGLYKIKTHIIADSPEVSSKLKKDLLDYYNHKYGEATSTTSSETWLFDDKEKILELRYLKSETEISLTFEALE